MYILTIIPVFERYAIYKKLLHFMVHRAYHSSGMSDQFRQQVFEELGKELRKLRLQKQLSIAEVSGAVEVDVETMAAWENGEARPSEEVLLLLIGFFDVPDEKATRIWSIAGYNSNGQPQDLIDDMHQVGAFVTPQDARILYTDMTHTSASKHGMTINFMQSAGPLGKPMIVSRVGMSREHAENLLKLLQEVLSSEDQDTPRSTKLLPPPKH